MELEGNNGLFVTGQLRCAWSVATASLRVGLEAVWGEKRAVLGHKMRSFGSVPDDLAPPAVGLHG